MSRARGAAAQLPLPLAPVSAPAAGPVRRHVMLGGIPLGVEFVSHRRARHYILRLADDGALRVTIPRGGSRAVAGKFIRERRAWIEREMYRRALEDGSGPWGHGTPMLFRGEPVHLAVEPNGAGGVCVRFADQTVTVPARSKGTLRSAVEAHLRRLATREIPARLTALAGQHGLTFTAVSVRNQRSRWGSCSPSGRISLNWRLIQLPPAVADYVLVHELAHIRHLNHSARFWKEVARLCPHFREARAWLRENHGLRPTGI